MLRKIIKFRVVGLVFLLSLIFISGGMLWAYLALNAVSGPLIIHFNNLVGINQIGNLGDLFWLGATGIVAVVLNFIVAMELESRDYFWGKLLAAATLLFSLLIFIGFAAIISVN